MTDPSRAPMEAIVLDAYDHIAVALVPLKPDQLVSVRIGSEDRSVRICQDIPRYHKFALAEICEGTMIRKGGEVIGRLYVPVDAGQHVHTHNLVGATAQS